MPVEVGDLEQQVATGDPTAPAQVAGGLFGVALGALGIALIATPRTLYLGLILAWAGPPLAVQWGWGLDRLLGRWRLWLAGIAVPAAYLCIADTVAIRDGIWRIAPETSTGWAVGGLPVEEALFFGLTGLHGCHVFLGLTLLGVALVRSLRGHYGPAAHDHLGVEIPGIYWHFVDVMWIVVYTTVYVI